MASRLRERAVRALQDENATRTQASLNLLARMLGVRSDDGFTVVGQFDDDTVRSNVVVSDGELNLIVVLYHGQDRRRSIYLGKFVDGKWSHVGRPIQSLEDLGREVTVVRPPPPEPEPVP